MKIFASWSGGKDCALATYRAIRQGHNISYLVNFITENGDRSMSHGVRNDVLMYQARAMGIPIVQIKTTWADYEANFKKAVTELKGFGVEGGVFGDMDVAEHRQWVERVCGEIGVKPLLPLWQAEPESLLNEFFHLGFKALVVADKLEGKLLGKSLDEPLITEIKAHGSHPCGENGEYHTFVTGGPIFKKPLKVITGERTQRDGVWFLDISVV